MHVPRTHDLLGLLLVGVLLLSPLASAVSLQGEVETDEGLSLDGRVAARTADGVVHLRSDGVDREFLAFEASEMTVAYEWESGYETGRAGHDPVLETRTEWGSESVTLAGVEGNLTGGVGTPEVLVVATGSGSEVSARASGSVEGRVVENETLTEAGDSADGSRNVGAEERVGFSYTVDGPWVSTDRLDSATARGDLLVFVNNVTLEASSEERDRWTHWTGDRTQQEAPRGARSYEQRVTVLQLSNATLWLAGQDSISLLGPSVDASVNGSVTGTRVDGELGSPARTFLYRDAGLELVGRGHTTMAGAPAQGRMAGIVSSSPEPVLRASLDGRFDVQRSPGIQVEEAPDRATTGLDLPLVGLGLGLLALAAVAFGARDRVLGWYTERKASRRRERVQRWRRVGDEAFQAREYEDALSWFERIVEHYPNSLEGWNSVASCLEELERYEEALDAYLEAASMMEEDVRVLVDAAGCAWRADRDEQAVALAVTVAEHDPGRLGRLSGPAFQGLREHPEVRKALGHDRQVASQSYV